MNEAITLYLLRSGESLSDLAKELGMSTATLWRKRKGISPFTLEEAAKIAKLTDTSIDELVGV
jgi:transcriptional regulator with XRE-family HTH domain